MKMFRFIGCLILVNVAGFAAPKQHVVALGKWTPIKWQADADANTNEKPVEVRIRPLYVDGKTREFTVGAAHDVTEKTFVVQRMFRLNDALPQENAPSRWRWERGGWLLIDRMTGKVQPIALPQFDSYTSTVNWFRDYAGYCGVSDDGKKALAMVAQLGRRKPLFKKTIADVAPEAPQCQIPAWQRDPVRVTFESEAQKITFVVSSRAVDVATEEETAGEE
jgi:hypothetical protein